MLTNLIGFILLLSVILLMALALCKSAYLFGKYTEKKENLKIYEKAMIMALNNDDKIRALELFEMVTNQLVNYIDEEKES